MTLRYSGFTIEEIFDYVHGLLDPALIQKLDVAATRDPELAAAIEIMQFLNPPLEDSVVGETLFGELVPTGRDTGRLQNFDLLGREKGFFRHWYEWLFICTRIESRIKTVVNRFVRGADNGENVRQLIWSYLAWCAKDGLGSGFFETAYIFLKDFSNELVKGEEYEAAKLILSELLLFVAQLEDDVSKPRDAKFPACLHRLGDVHYLVGETIEGKRLLLEATEAYRAYYGDSSSYAAERICEIASALKANHEFDAAKQQYAILAGMFKNIAGTNSPRYLAALKASEQEPTVSSVGREASDSPGYSDVEVISSNNFESLSSTSSDDKFLEPQRTGCAWVADLILISYAVGWSLTIWRAYCEHVLKDFNKALTVAKFINLVSTGTHLDHRSAHSLGKLYWLQGEVAQAKEHLELAEKIARRGKHKFGLLVVVGSLADLYTSIGEVELASQYIEELQRLQDGGEVKKLNEASWISKQNSIAIYYNHRGETKKAIELLERVSNWIQSHSSGLATVNDRYRLSGVVTGNLAVMYKRIQNHKKAEELQERSRRLLEHALKEGHPALSQKEGIVSVAVRINNQVEMLPLMLAA